MRAVIIAAAIIALAAPAAAQQTTFTDSSGRYSGSAVRNGNSSSFTDQRGSFARGSTGCLKAAGSGKHVLLASTLHFGPQRTSPLLSGCKMPVERN